MVIGLSFDYLLHPPSLQCMTDMENSSWFPCNIEYGCLGTSMTRLDDSSPYTFSNWMTDLHLYCESSVVLGSIGSSNFLGLAIGCYIVGRISDVFGRRPVLLISMVGCVGSVVWMLLVQSLFSLYGALFLYGFFNGCRSIAAYALCLELVDTKMRKNMSVITNMSICLGILFSSLTFLFYKDSTIFLTIILVVMVVSTFIIYLIPESPEYLLSHHKFDQLRSVFSFIARINC